MKNRIPSDNSRRAFLALFGTLTVAPILYLSGCGSRSGSYSPTSKNTISNLIPSTGGSIELTGIARVTFPSGAFSASRKVTVSKSNEDFLSHKWTSAKAKYSAKSRSNYEVKIDISGESIQTESCSVEVNVPSEVLLESSNENAAEVLVYAASAEGSMILINSSYSNDGDALVFELPNWAFARMSEDSDSRSTYIIITSTPGPKPSMERSVTKQTGASDQCDAKAIGPPLRPQLIGPLAPNQQFGERDLCYDPIRQIMVSDGHKCFHSGVDLSAPLGSEVLAADDGNLIQTGYEIEGGFYAVVAHPHGNTAYYHLDGASLNMDPNQQEPTAITVIRSVKQGEVIARTGTSGKATTGPHLHFEYYPNGGIFDGKTPINPFPCITTEDATGSILIADNGPSNDDIFEVAIDAVVLGRTPKGGSDTFGLNNLRAGKKVLQVKCIDDGNNGNDVGTLGISLKDGVTFEDGSVTLSDRLELNEIKNYAIIVPPKTRRQSSSFPVLPKNNISEHR